MPGDLGTKGGLRTDERARVLRPDGTVIAGLYAAGNASASVMGHSYAGAGATIGPAMTFGYLAALDLAGALTAGGHLSGDGAWAVIISLWSRDLTPCSGRAQTRPTKFPGRLARSGRGQDQAAGRDAGAGGDQHRAVAGRPG